MMAEKDRSKLSFMSFWSINDELDPARLKAQLEELKAAGLNGVLHSIRLEDGKVYGVD